MQVADIKFHFTGDSFGIQRDGEVVTVWTARILEMTPNAYLSNMIGKNVENPDGVYCKIKAVESFAIPYLSPNTPIGLQLEPLERPF